MPARILGVDLGNAAWLPRAARLSTAGATRDWITVPQQDANRLLGGVVRLVADLPPRSSPEVVWTSGGSELMVHTDRSTLRCNLGVLQVGVVVSCDQVDGMGNIVVPFVTGTSDDTRGLFMATFDRPAGPPILVDVWSAAATAFAWECVLTLASQLCAAAGKDGHGRPFIPAAIGSVRGGFQVHPMVQT